MKRIIYKAITRSLLLAALTVMTLTSCLKDSLDNCPGGFNVRLIVTPDYADARSNPADWYGIDCTHVYIFNADNTFVDCAEGGAFTGEDYVFDLDLEPGEYHFVAWTNHGDTYKTNISMEDCHELRPASSDLELFMQYTPGEDIAADIPDLHYGALTGAIAESGKNNHFTIVMRPNTYRVNFTVKGLPITTDDYDFTITDSNSDYKFDNSIVPDKDDFTYRRTSQFEDAEIKATHKMLRLEHGRVPLFAFTNATTSEPLHQDDLVKMIRSAYENNGQTVDFDAVHTFDITLLFETDMSVTVTVNGWKYTSQSGPLG